MDINDLRSVVTLVSFAVFAGIAAWAWWPARRNDFEQAANLPFQDEGAAR